MWRTANDASWSSAVSGSSELRQELAGLGQEPLSLTGNTLRLVHLCAVERVRGLLARGEQEGALLGIEVAALDEAE